MASIRFPAGEFPGPAASNQSGMGWRAAVQAVEKALPEFLPRHRWYPAKDAGRPDVKLAEFATLDWGLNDAAIAIWRVTPPRGPALLMFVPLAVVPSNQTSTGQAITITEGPGGRHAVVDALSLDSFVCAWLNFQLTENSDASRVSPLHAGRTGHSFGFEMRNATISRSQTEQSNTSLRIGNRAIVKFIRKPEAGPHPELEIGRFLGAAGFTATPPLLGWTEFVGQTGGHYAVSMLQEFVPNQGDGWSWTLERLTRAILSNDIQAGDELAQWLSTLATRLAQLHRVFASGSTDPEFCLEPVTPDDLRNWESAAQAMAERAFEGIVSHRSDGDAGQLMSAVINRREAVAARLRKVVELRSSFCKTRHHGDFHLGQALVAGTDAMIIDFEGEPLRPLAERRMKHCVLRDVAGALRSLAYAAATVGRGLPTGVPLAEHERLTRALEQWHAGAAINFVQFYLDSAAGLASMPASRNETAALLNFFVLEKALYEIAYELANRPDWVTIPLAGVLSLIGNQVTV